MSIDELHKSQCFFKVILDTTLENKELMIPRSFVKKYGKELSNPVTLMLPNGDKWKINWIKRDDHDVWFQNGWEKFAQHYSMSFGHFLVFKFEKESQFQVMIFDKSALEIDYLSKGLSSRDNDDDQRNNQHHDEDAEKKDNDNNNNYIEISDDENEMLRSSSPQPHKRMKINDGSSQRKELKKEKINLVQEVKAKNRSTNNEAMTRNEALKDTTRRAMDLHFDNPSFIRPLHQSYLQNLFIPTWFSKQYLNGKKGIATIVIGEEDKTWDLKFKFNDVSNRTMLHGGWGSIVEEYDLKVGDICVFELIDGKSISFKVHIVRANA
ncbi:B3 domain-containing transcription factor VRN1-like isoform X2 [Trifolium pratense]|uniref:B3 domain-containing transcription factor VRN1-like isoform X2 n=1 Tax=Trifolium pratense TaxID=57577 RepID=UPI001E697816|nr:B3 domain-containing transcription factor VRN1-like isoform X2 [Trifolium pratense]